MLKTKIATKTFMKMKFNGKCNLNYNNMKALLQDSLALRIYFQMIRFPAAPNADLLPSSTDRPVNIFFKFIIFS